LPAFARGDLPVNLGTVLVSPFAGVNSKWTLVPLLAVLMLWTWLCLRPRKARSARAGQTEASPA
jgi:hypothetical protein